MIEKLLCWIGLTSVTVPLWIPCKEPIQKHSGMPLGIKCDANLHLKACGQDWIRTMSLENLLKKVACCFGSTGILRMPRLVHRDQSLMAFAVCSDIGHWDCNSCDPAMETSSATSFNPATNSVPRTEIKLISPGILLYPCLSWPCPPAFSLSWKQFCLLTVPSEELKYLLISFSYANTDYSGFHLKIVEWEMQFNVLEAETGSLVSFSFYVGCLVTKFHFTLTEILLLLK